MNTPVVLPDYAELRCLSNFSFLQGASRPEELVERARALGYRALALVDECSLAGVVRAHVAAKKHALQLLVGSQFQVRCDTPFTLIVLACNLNGYGNLCEFITHLRRSAPKGTYRLTVRLAFHGPLDDDQRRRLHAAVARCPIHKLMTSTTVEISTAE